MLPGGLLPGAVFSGMPIWFTPSFEFPQIRFLEMAFPDNSNKNITLINILYLHFQLHNLTIIKYGKQFPC